MISGWLDEFKSAWIAKDLDRVLDLFADDVEYWETPFIKLENKEQLRSEWGAITNQQHIKLTLDAFSSIGKKHCVLWELSYESPDSTRQDWSGTYLMELDSIGKCTYFHQTGEKR